MVWLEQAVALRDVCDRFRSLLMWQHRAQMAGKVQYKMLDALYFPDMCAMVIQYADKLNFERSTAYNLAAPCRLVLDKA